MSVWRQCGQTGTMKCDTHNCLSLPPPPLSSCGFVVGMWRQGNRLQITRNWERRQPVWLQTARKETTLDRFRTHPVVFSMKSFQLNELGLKPVLPVWDSLSRQAHPPYRTTTASHKMVGYGDDFGQVSQPRQLHHQPSSRPNITRTYHHPSSLRSCVVVLQVDVFNAKPVTSLSCTSWKPVQWPVQRVTGTHVLFCDCCCRFVVWGTV